MCVVCVYVCRRVSYTIRFRCAHGCAAVSEFSSVSSIFVLPKIHGIFHINWEHFLKKIKGIKKNGRSPFFSMNPGRASFCPGFAEKNWAIWPSYISTKDSNLFGQISRHWLRFQYFQFECPLSLMRIILIISETNIAWAMAFGNTWISQLFAFIISLWEILSENSQLQSHNFKIKINRCNNSIVFFCTNGTLLTRKNRKMPFGYWHVSSLLLNTTCFEAEIFAEPS